MVYSTTFFTNEIISNKYCLTLSVLGLLFFFLTGYNTKIDGAFLGSTYSLGSSTAESNNLGIRQPLSPFPISLVLLKQFLQVLSPHNNYMFHSSFFWIWVSIAICIVSVTR
ncbi:hypothetical protein CEXT_115261 [Caerostris extrusa]|uniref:Uncharacterized protein n=1 Tax=Caerostris extrusa TaxID=172846 RepID=A0AAV4Y938_CAEEX|nr:hypothetical protein CEXT_115261 [Caerostris extrusa]